MCASRNDRTSAVFPQALIKAFGKGIVNNDGIVRKAGGSLPVAYCSLAVACCLLLVSQKWGHNSYILLYIQFPVLVPVHRTPRPFKPSLNDTYLQTP